MREIELIEKRKAREKHFLQEDGTIIAKIYNEDIHYMKNGIYEEIDNTLVENEDYYVNNKNSYKVKFGKSAKEKLLTVQQDNNFIEFDLKSKKNYSFKQDNLKSIYMKDIKDNIDIKYDLNSNKIKESIILNEKTDINSKFEFEINTNLQLKLNNDGSITASDNLNNIFKIETPFMIDANNIISENVSYRLKKFLNKTIIELNVDEKWLMDCERKYPVVIDPTITNVSNSSGVQDTYICSDTPDVNYNARDYLLIGSELYDDHNAPTHYRALIKFILPEIPTSCEIVEANLRIIGYPHEDMYFHPGKRLIEIHKINESWNESQVTWNNMNNKYDSRVESCFYGGQSYYETNNDIIWEEHYANITGLVKKWYTNEENYGIMLKTTDESGLDSDGSFIPKFMSNANIVSGENPQPTLMIRYRNHNGLEDYLEYFTQDFTVGSMNINSFNGNLVGIFNIASLRNGKLPVALNIVYNTNDVVSGYNEGYGLGCRLSLSQTIEYNANDDIFSYVDFDGTTHFFVSSKEIFDSDGNLKKLREENVYYDEDGLELKIMVYESKYEIIDKEGIILEFTKQSINKGILTKIIGKDNNYINIMYNNGVISKVLNSEGDEITLSYSNNYITVNFPNNQTRISYSNNRIYTVKYGESDYDCIPLYFDYNERNLIMGVQYGTDKRATYEYYDKFPYKVKKVLDSKDTFFNLNYNTSSTTLTDNLGRVITLTFNDYGNVCSISNLKSQDFVKSALGRIGSFGQGYQEKNKITTSGNMIGYINNILTNTSFENDEIIWQLENGININIVNETSLSGHKSLKVLVNEENKYIFKSIDVEKGKPYTFSAYIKNNTKSNIKFILEYTANNNQIISSETKIIKINNDFNRYDVSINYPNDALSQLKIKIGAEKECEFYVDDIQFEEGYVANQYNYIENSDFSNGTTGWRLNASLFGTGESIPVNERFEIVQLTDGSKALKIKMGLLYSTGIDKMIPIYGKQGDSYTISFWYKNQGIKCYDDFHYNCCLVNFAYEYGQCAIPSINLNPNNEEWQFFSYTFVAEQDYSSISLSIFQSLDANDLYITNISLLKNIKQTYISYNENGDVSLIKNMAENTNKFDYDEENKLIQIYNDNQSNFTFEYDRNDKKKIINGISQYGVSNELKYNENGKPVITRSSNKTIINLIDGIYKIRVSGTRKYLNFVNKNLTLSESDDIKTHWIFESEIISNEKYFKIYHTIINDAYISNISSNVGIDCYDINKSLFKIIKNKNGSHYIKLYNDEKYIKVVNNNIIFDELDSNCLENYEFYFELQRKYKFIENSGTYADNGKYIETITNSSLNKVKYDYDPTTGVLNSITNPYGVETYYFYNNKTKNITGMYSNEKSVSYIYNDNKISTVNYIVSGNIKKSYFYSYDDYNRLKTIRVGLMNLSYPLFTNQYDDETGNLKEIEYANNSLKKYEYDNLDRLYKISTDDDEYKHYYYQNGLLGKIVSNNSIYKYVYDEANRIKKYIYDDFNVYYTYNIDGKLVDIKYELNDYLYQTNYEFEFDEMNTFINCDEDKTQYIYDELGRIIAIKQDDNLYYQKEYLCNGNRDLSLIRNIIFSNNKYQYKYDKTNNVKTIYNNGIIEKKYLYDKFNQLVREDNYTSKRTQRYFYDQSGNLISKKIYKLNSYDLIQTYDYGYYMPYNIDVLTSFNNESISYDDCFNPTSIGEKVTLTWKNRNKLSSYKNVQSNLNVNYKYDKDGYRIEKNVNDEKIEYYWSNCNLIIQKFNNNILYFIYDAFSNLVGFKYNNIRYNYLKNGLNEICGIIDKYGNVKAKYEYDAWGNILKILDENNNDVSNNINHIANINPFRFKCYYYDNETKLYYLKNRYYNPQWGRYISPDETINNDIHGTNPYIYCENDPINKEDGSGEFCYPLVKFGIGAIIGVVTNAVTNVATGKDWNEGLVAAAIGGGVGMLIDVPILGTAISSATQSIINEVSSYISDVDVKFKKDSKSPISVEVNTKKEVNSKNVSESLKNVAVDTVSGALVGVICEDLKIGKLSDKIAKFNSGWFEPKSLKGVFNGKYTFRFGLSKLIEGTFETAIDEGVNLILGPTELSDATIYPEPPPCIFETRCHVQFPIIKQ